MSITEKMYNQESRFLETIEPKYRQNVKQLIVNYDLSHSILNIAIQSRDNYENFKKIIEKELIKREAYIIDLFSSFKNLGNEIKS